MTNGIKEFLIKHGLQIFFLVLTGFGVVMVYQAKVDANAEGIKDNEAEIKRVDAKYPSEKWFNLKFKTITEEFKDVDERMDRFETIIDGRATVNRF